MKISTKTTILDFQELETLSDLATLLGFAPKTLSFILYKLDGGPNGQYKNFEIKKRSGGVREIASPNSGLKGIQRQLANKLNDIYMPKKAVHGFVREKTILTNAREHSRKRYVFKIDLKDFFPSVHFGRIVGLFTSKPYMFQRNISILIAKIACLDDKLPQGSPCSPIISNMICAYMDAQISNLSKTCGCYYTRYADDMTFSTNKKEFPKEIAIYNDEIWQPGNALMEIVTRNTFSVNAEKTLMRTRSDRQLVTGIVVNDYPNIRQRLLKQVRAMLHDWQVNGLDKAQEKYSLLYDLGNREAGENKNIDFKNVVRGKLEHLRYVRNYRIELLNKIDKEECIRNRTIYKKNEFQTIHKDQFYKYYHQFELVSIRDSGMPTILGEGKTDWMHLRRAFCELKMQKKYSESELNIFKNKEYALGGYVNLKKFYESANDIDIKFPHPVICVFDADIDDINNKHKDADSGYLYHGNNIYSIVLPKPNFRSDEKFSIELYYKDDDLLKENYSKRRLYLNLEFDKTTGVHVKHEDIIYGVRARDGKQNDDWKSILKSDLKVIDSSVCIKNDGKLKNIAMSKKDFALQIVKKIKPFDKMDFSAFIGLFDIIEKICVTHNCSMN